jgi:hypothetical protein
LSAVKISVQVALLLTQKELLANDEDAESSVRLLLEFWSRVAVNVSARNEIDVLGFLVDGHVTREPVCPNVVQYGELIG